MNERLTKPVPVPPSWKYLLLKQMALQELDKVLSIESYAEVTKRNGDNNELDPLKSCHWTVFKRKKTYYPLGIVHSREFHNSKEIDCRITQDMHLQIPSPKTMNEKSQPQPQKKGRPSIIDSGDGNWTFIPEVDYFHSDFRTACFFVMLEWVFITWHRFAY